MRSKTLAQAEFISAEHFNALGVPFDARIKWEAADEDVKSILNLLASELGAILC